MIQKNSLLLVILLMVGFGSNCRSAIKNLDVRLNFTKFRLETGGLLVLSTKQIGDPQEEHFAFLIVCSNFESEAGFLEYSSPPHLNLGSAHGFYYPGNIARTPATGEIVNLILTFPGLAGSKKVVRIEWDARDNSFTLEGTAYQSPAGKVFVIISPVEGDVSTFQVEGIQSGEDPNKLLKNLREKYPDQEILQDLAF